MSLDSLKLQIKSRLEQMRLYRMYSKVCYLVASTFGNLHEEGFYQTGVRIVNFVRYGKGVAQGKKYATLKDEESSDIIFDFEHIRPYIRGDELEPYNRQKGWSSDEPVDVIVPVYNGLEYLEPLFSSVVEKTNIAYRLIIIDDASPDPAVKIFLRDFVRKTNKSLPELEIILEFNDANKGFVATVNRAMQYVRGHFVLLNTDTEVPSEWLQRLMVPIFSDDTIATTTPYTNAGEIFNFPRLAYVDPSQELIANISYERIDSVLERSLGKDVIFDVPTGMGFCMGVNYHVFKELSLKGDDTYIALFDEEAFGRGYGEETDFCLKAKSKGYRNVHVPNLFVYHKHGGSFAPEHKKQLIQDHMRIIEKRYPGYNRRIKKFFDEDQYKALREFLYAKILIGTSDGVSLIFDNSLGGGACMFADRLVQKRLDQGFPSVHIRYEHLHKKYSIVIVHPSQRWTFSVENMTDLLEFLGHFEVCTIYVNELVSYPQVEEVQRQIIELKKRKSARVVFYVHDYFCVCPNFTLVNEKSEYCGVPDLPKDLQACERCLLKTQTNYKVFSRNRDILQWRAAWQTFFDDVDEIHLFSDASASIVTKAYENVSGKIVVESHDTNYTHNLLSSGENEESHSKEGTFRIGVLGDISYTKGSHVLSSLAQHIQRESLAVEIVLFGESSGLKKYRCVKKMGRYSLEGLQGIVAQESIDIFLIPSIWPETFSYTTSEVIAMNYPLAVFDIGAPAERVKQYSQGLILESKLPVDIVSDMQSFLRTSR